MPGPGGGSQGGGFGGGSNGGGGFGGSGGGFGGGFGRPGGFGHRPPFFHFHRPHFFGFGRPYGYGYGGGGCLGGVLGLFITPILILIFVGVFLFSTLTSSFRNVINGGEILYDEPQIQEYADKQYALEFGNSSAYEDNILIVFLTDEEAQGYYSIAWVGYNIEESINQMFGNQYTDFGIQMLSQIPDYYENSISRNLASVVNNLSSKIQLLGLESSFLTEADHSNMTESHVTNHSHLNISEETINNALVSFTEKTDIPIVIVMDDISNVFPKTIDPFDIVIVVVALGIAGVSIFYGIKTYKKNKEKKEKEEKDNGDSTSW